jgi:hypothetical protein
MTLLGQRLSRGISDRRAALAREMWPTGFLT